MLVLELPIEEDWLAELEEEGDFTFFTSLVISNETKAIQVHLRRRRFYDLIYAAASIEDAAHQSNNPPLVEGARLVRR